MAETEKAEMSNRAKKREQRIKEGKPIQKASKKKKKKGGPIDTAAPTTKVEEMRAWRKQVKEDRKQSKLAIRKERGDMKNGHGQTGKGKGKGQERAAGQSTDQPEKEKKAPPVEVQQQSNDKGDKGAKRRERECDAGSKASAGEAAEPVQKKAKKPTEEAMEPVAVDPEAFKVVVAGIPHTIDEARLRKDFAKGGEVLNLRLLKDRTTRVSRGIAFISFTGQDGLDAALARNGEDYRGRSLLVEVAQGSAKTDGKGRGKGGADRVGEKPAGCTSVMVKGLSYSVTEADLMDTFKSCGGGPLHVNILCDRETGASRGMAFVDFEGEAAVDDAMRLHGTELKGRRFQMDYAAPREKGKGPGEKPPGCTSVVVKSLAYDVTEGDLQQTFRRCGDGPTGIRMIKDKATGTFRGMAFVDFEGSESAVDEAVQLHGTELKGRCFIMDYAGASDDKRQSGEENQKRGKRKPPGCTSIVLHDLAEGVSESRLMKVFKACGEGPRNINIVMDAKTGEPTGSAFVNFAAEGAVDEAMELDGTNLKGRVLSIGYVKPKAKKQQ